MKKINRKQKRLHEPSGANKPVNRRTVDIETFRNFGDIEQRGHADSPRAK
jgi:hypothetical protein